MPRLKPAELETRNREIIVAARRCFLRNGFHQTTTDDICREASITPGGLYHYFGSKEEIIAAVIEDVAQEAVTTLGSLVQQSADTRSSVRALVSVFSQSLRDPDLDTATRLDVEIWAETLRNEKLAEITRRGWAMRRQWLESLIERAKADGVYSQEVDSNGLANLIMTMWLGLRLGRVLWREDFNVDATLDALFLMHSGRLTQTDVMQPLTSAAPSDGAGGEAGLNF